MQTLGGNLEKQDQEDVKAIINTAHRSIEACKKRLALAVVRSVCTLTDMHEL